MRLGEVLRKWRKMTDLGVRDAAREIGLTTPTLSRVERGGLPDARTLAKILSWLMDTTKKEA